MNTENPCECIICNSLLMCTIPLACTHQICSIECFNSLLKTQVDGNLQKYSQLSCPSCSEKIGKEVFYSIYGGEDSFRAELNRISKLFEPKIECPFCYFERPASDFITLDCDHRYCAECMIISVTSLINEFKVGKDMTCPECSKIIDPQIVYSLIGPDNDLREKYDHILLLRLEASLKGEKYITCIARPGVECNYQICVSLDNEDYTCRQCGTRFCPKCNGDVHPKMTCKEAKMMKNEDPKIKEDIEAGLALYCPWCDSLIYKDGGCKYMSCQSESCRGKNQYFCWACKAKLTEKHQMHPCHAPDVISNKIKSACRIF